MMYTSILTVFMASHELLTFMLEVMADFTSSYEEPWDNYVFVSKVNAHSPVIQIFHLIDTHIYFC